MHALRVRKVQFSRWWTVPPVLIVLAFNILLEHLWPTISGWVQLLILAKFEDISINGTLKEDENKQQGQRFQSREREAARAIAEIEGARNARLPWPIRTVGSVLD
jgi:hypothetical protein